MGGLLLCSGCCLFLSAWAIIQLVIMGICYQFQAVTFIEDVEPHSGYDDYDQFIKLTKENYSSTAINCWITAAMYALTLVLSCLGLHRAKKAEKKAAVRREDDEYSCRPKNPKTKGKKK